MKYVVRKASECPPDAIVIPFTDKESATEVARDMNNGSRLDGWLTGPAREFVYDDGDDDWCITKSADGVSK